jgi:predicted transcriptional regulator
MAIKDGRLFLRFDPDEKARLEKLAEEFAKLRPEGAYTVSSICRAAILAKVDEMEKELKAIKKPGK